MALNQLFFITSVNFTYRNAVKYSKRSYAVATAWILPLYSLAGGGQYNAVLCFQCNKYSFVGRQHYFFCFYRYHGIFF